jgi:UTP:GlnB (protein PII) uridylyltransferase
VGAPPDPVETLRASVDALERAYSPGHHGTWVARRRAQLVDVALRALFTRADAPRGTALAAVGGYGRGMLLPGSDIDVLLLHDGSDAAAVARRADAQL